MPRPGYEPEEGDSAEPAGADSLLQRFDQGVQTELVRRLADKELERGHVVQIYRLVSMSPEDRDGDTIDELIETALGMSSEDFKEWVDERIAQNRDR